jgi:hypothetical protein
MQVISSPIASMDWSDSARKLGLESFIPILVFTAIIGFTLSSLNTFIYKTFEGYFLLHHFRFLQRRQQKQAKRLQQSLTRKEKRLEKIEKRLEEAPTNRIIREKLKRSQSALQGECYALATQLDSKYPPSSAYILPTRFGNALRAAEGYSNSRYGIDGVPIWPRLVHVMPSTYYEKLELTNNGLAFLLNCATLSFVAAIICLFASFHQLYSAYCQVNSANGLCNFLGFTRSTDALSGAAAYFLLGITMLVLFRGFYNAAIPVLGRYGDLIRSSYDLFRFELLTALHIAQPQDSDEEHDTWRKISEFIAIGRRRGSMYFEYQIPIEPTDDETD